MIMIIGTQDPDMCVRMDHSQIDDIVSSAGSAADKRRSPPAPNGEVHAERPAAGAPHSYTPAPAEPPSVSPATSVAEANASAAAAAVPRQAPKHDLASQGAAMPPGKLPRRGDPSSVPLGGQASYGDDAMDDDTFDVALAGLAEGAYAGLLPSDTEPEAEEKEQKELN